ncbi:MAG TPA: adenylate cyclase regulatory domain-containing protein [Acidimicrobiales bacterium]|nr:adenylate cyclase regulatory domain-containing protein [Acidimicrobiales bacterium]
MPGRPEALAGVRRFLRRHGATEEEIDRAESEGVLDLLVADRLLVPAGRRYTEKEVSERTGMPVELARKFWRALGFPDPVEDDPVFTDLDVQALVTIRAFMDVGLVELDTALQLARVIGSSMARIAEAEISPAVLGAPLPLLNSLKDNVEAADFFARRADQMIPAMGSLLEFSWRRHLQAATRRAMLLRSRNTGALPSLCVGFADMVGFTLLSQQLSEAELAVVVGRFEEVAHDTVTGFGGRLVKMIGDEAMFVTDAAVPAARIALALAEVYAHDELLSDVRVGLAEGPVLVQDGDYYGPVVNLAHAVVAVADPGTVLLSDDFHSTLLREMPPAAGDTEGSAEGEFAFRSVRPRPIKDVGRVQLWALYRPGSRPPSFQRGIARRWERLAEVVGDMEELRQRGERLLTGGLRAAVGDGAEGAQTGDDEGSRAGDADGGDAEGAQFEAPVERGQGPAAEIDQPT